MPAVEPVPPAALAASLGLFLSVLTLWASLLLGYVRFEPRWSAVFPVWAAINLLTTCVSEEAFFRGLLQRETQVALSRMLEPRNAGTIAVLVSATLFGLAHAAGGWSYVVVSSLAGAGYALVYQRTGRLEMTVLAHFTLNAVHFLMFTYPGLH